MAQEIEQLAKVLNENPGITSSSGALSIGFIYILARFPKARRAFLRTLNIRKGSREKALQSIRVVVEESFSTQKEISRMRFVDLRRRRSKYIDDRVLEVFVLVLERFAKELNKDETGAIKPKLAIELKLFENTSRLILNLVREHIEDDLEDFSLTFTEEEFRRWICQKIDSLNSFIRREIYESYPSSGTSISIEKIREKILHPISSELRDVIFETFHHCRDLSAQIEKEVEKKKADYHRMKTRILSVESEDFS